MRQQSQTCQKGKNERATGAFPQLRLVGVVETGAHVLCGTQP